MESLKTNAMAVGDNMQRASAATVLILIWKRRL